jgi:hypothetical protein
VPIVSSTSQSSPEINIQTSQEQPSSSQQQSTPSTETDTKDENNQGLHLQPGDYYVATAYSIGVFQREDRICILVSSRNGVNIASVYIDPNNPDIYRVHGYRDWVLQQKDFRTVVFNDMEYKVDEGFGIPEPSENVQQCLNSVDPFFMNAPGTAQR